MPKIIINGIGIEGAPRTSVQAKHSAYYALTVDPAKTEKVVLPYNERLKSPAQGRNLVVTVPSASSLTGEAHISGAFGARSLAENVFSQTPTDAELRQLHVLGVALQYHVMAGEKDLVGAIWAEGKQGGREIIIPHVFIMRKFGHNLWSPGFYKNKMFEPDYPSGFYGKAIRSSLQEAADYLCGALHIPLIDLSAAMQNDKLPAFPTTRARKAAYRKAAVRLRRDGFGNITKLRA